MTNSKFRIQINLKNENDIKILKNRNVVLQHLAFHDFYELQLQNVNRNREDCYLR